MTRWIGVLAGSALLAGGGVAVAFTFGSGYTLTVHVLSADGLVPGNDVDISGVPIGSVQSVAIDPSGTQMGATAVITVDAHYAPLRQGSHFTVREKGLLGTMFLDVTPGQGDALASGSAVPLEDTTSPVDLDQVTDIFDPNTRAKIRTMTLEGGRMLSGAGPDINQLLRQLPQISGDAAGITGSIAADEQQLDALTVEFDRIAADMAAEDRSFRGDIGNGSSILDTLAAHQQGLQDELVNAAGALTLIDQGLGGSEQDLNHVLQELPALEDSVRAASSASAVPLSAVYPCTSDIVSTITELQSATTVQVPAGSTDGRGYTFRVLTNFSAPSFAGEDAPAPAEYPCRGGR